MKIYRSQRAVIEMLFCGRIYEIERDIKRLERRLVSPKTKPKAIANLQSNIDFQTKWLADIQEAYQQFKQEPNIYKEELTRLQERLSSAQKERIKASEEHFAFLDQVREIMAEDGLEPDEFISRQSLSIRLSAKYRSN